MDAIDFGGREAIFFLIQHSVFLVYTTFHVTPATLPILYHRGEGTRQERLAVAITANLSDNN
jgi:hypothetical protein